jgi:hypothetical protein
MGDKAWVVPQQLIPLMGKPSRVLLTPKCDVPNITPGQALGRVLSSGQRGCLRIGFRMLSG